MKTNSIGNSFTIEKILKIYFQNFHISWKASKSISWKFLGSLHNEIIVKYVFHGMLWKKFFTVYPRFKNEKLQEHFGDHCYYLEYSYYFVYICRLWELKRTRTRRRRTRILGRALMWLWNLYDLLWEEKDFCIYNV